MPSIFPSEDEKETQRDERPKSPNAQQLDERNEIPPARKRKSSTRPLGRSSSADSFSGIPIVDDQSIGSNSEKNTEVEKRKKRLVRSKKKDVETNTEISRAPSRANEPDPVNVNVTVLVKKYPGDETPKTKKNSADEEFHRATQSDSEQIVSEKQKKRRRPKRISRTTQTYECVFRRMAEEEHRELQPNGETERSVQTRRSRLRPRTRSPSKPLPVYLSTDAFRSVTFLHFAPLHSSRSESKKFFRNNFLQRNEMFRKRRSSRATARRRRAKFSFFDRRCRFITPMR